ncbi:MAG: biopolymer transporter TolR [Bacteroidota bacterium]
MKFHLAFFALLMIAAALYAQPTGPFTGFTHVGNPTRPGASSFNEGEQTYQIEGASSNMWFSNDDFHFLWKKMKGDFILTAQVAFVSAGGGPHRKAGWMVRHSLEANSPHASGMVHGDGLTSLQVRATPGGETVEINSDLTHADILQLERRGNEYIFSAARWGEPLATVATQTLQLGDDVYAGIFLCSHNEQVVEKALFKNVRLVVPAPKSLVAYRQYLASHLEVMNVATGHRKILYTDSTSIQAPNWTTDGSALIYNKSGLLFRYRLSSGEIKQIPTGFATRNNNDHVLSFDGQQLGISHHSEEDQGVSMVYTLPAAGGTPKKITTVGPSYLHGWSPDARWLIYTGGRNDEYDIYKISAKGGKEIKLTNSKGLDDGSEYSPDGKYIYFNSVRSGTMQLWRMRPDGSQPEQLTNDSFNNWFPHVSPDGQWIVFLSYGPEVAPGDHPFYKQVQLRLMPANGGPVRTLAYLYGGQGTINVPSWSPDGKQVAFVSNTALH